MNLSLSRVVRCSISSMVSSLPTSHSHFRSFSLSPLQSSLLAFPQFRVCGSARKRSPDSENPTTIVDEGDALFDDFGEDDDFGYAEDEYAEDGETFVGDGEGGGGISLAGTWWDKKALELAQEVSLSFDGELNIYAFKTSSNPIVRVRIENLSVIFRDAMKELESGSPSMEDVEAFTRAYRARLDEAELAKSIPEKLYLEVSSPGVERIVRIPQDLDRFKERSMYVKYVTETAESGSPSEEEGVFRLVSFDLDTQCCTWGIADVRVNREKAGKGRPLNKKQRDWRLDTPFASLQLVRLYSE